MHRIHCVRLSLGGVMALLSSAALTLLTGLADAKQPNLATPVGSTEWDQKRVISFPLQHARAETAVEIVQQLFADLPAVFSVEPESNTVYARILKDDPRLRQIEELFASLDERALEARRREPPPNEMAKQIKVFELRHADAASMLRLVLSLFPDSQLSLDADPTTNKLIARGSETELGVIEALLLRMDTESAERSLEEKRQSVEQQLSAIERSARDPDNDPRVTELRQQLGELNEQPRPPGVVTAERIGEGMLLRGKLEDVESLRQALSDAKGGDSQVARLRARYEQAERAAAERAAEYRRLDKAVGVVRADVDLDGNLDVVADRAVNAQDLADLREKVVSAVATAFELRQQLQSAEVDQSRKLLEAIDRRSRQRETFKEKIIQRRVEELIAGEDLSWPDSSE